MKKLIAAIMAILGTALLTIICVAETGSDFSASLTEMIKKYQKDDFVGSIIMQIDNSMMYVDGKEIVIDEDGTTTPILIDGSAMVPLRAISEALGYNVSYDADNSKITIQYGIMTADMQIGDNHIKISYENNIYDEKVIDINAKPFINEFNRTMVPLRPIVENIFAGSVVWNGKNQSMYITKDFQTKRLVVQGQDDDMDFSRYEPVEIIKNDKNMYVLQLDMNTPDILVKQYCDEIGKLQGVEYAEPDQYVVVTY